MQSCLCFYGSHYKPVLCLPQCNSSLFNVATFAVCYTLFHFKLNSALQSVLPFFVATKMTRIRKPTLDKPTPERYVAAALTTIGLQDQTNGYFPHAVMVRLYRSSPLLFLLFLFLLLLQQNVLLDKSRGTKW